MARSNEDRMHAPVSHAPTNSNPTGLKFIVPTELVDLPSKGKFYPPDHPLHNKETIEITHMTTREEDILTSHSLIEKGVALDKMLQSVIVNKNIIPDALLVGDKNAIIIGVRAHSYGKRYETTFECPLCGTNSDFSFDLSTLKGRELPSGFMEENNIQKTENNTFIINLPSVEYAVEVKHLDGLDEKKLVETAQHKRKNNFPESMTSDFLRLIIVSVNSITERAQINEFVNTLPIRHSRHIRNMYDVLLPSLDMQHQFNCTNCTHEGFVEVPLNVDFFWPKS